MNSRIQSRVLYEQLDLPIFQNRMYDTAFEAKTCQRGDVRLIEDGDTGLIYNATFRPEFMIYDASYQNEQAVSPLFRQHLELVSQIIDRTMGKGNIIEVGCGKGFFLEMLQAKGHDVAGFDPAYEGQNSRVQKRYFDHGAGLTADGIVLRHVLEHIQNPFEFLQQLQKANRGGGTIYIEVPRFEWICEHRAWFDIFYEHANYFRLSDFCRMFGTIVEGGALFGDQYLYVVADLATLKRPRVDPSEMVDFPSNFADRITALIGAPSAQSAIWGGASKGVIFAMLKARAGYPIYTVIDINPAKQGKYLPATGIQVQSPSDGLSKLPKGSTIYIMNSNYTDEIRKMSGNAFEYVPIDHA